METWPKIGNSLSEMFFVDRNIVIPVLARRAVNQTETNLVVGDLNNKFFFLLLGGGRARDIV